MLFSEWLGKMYTMDQFLQACITPVCKEYHLSGTEMTVLLFLYNNPEKNTATDIIKFSRMAKANISKAVEHMIRRDLLVRTRDAQDRRVVHLCLTETALCMMPDLLGAAEQYLRGIFADFSPEEMHTFSEFNTRMAANAESRLQKNKK
ncbi:MAG: winged helix DNA-binding protein [Clostridia bacterium]|nr:winged helix DNA-binding protein [Clostridia bacterium]MBO7297174.1 winged helix DNA-binding protein [Clostridia bacterium]